MLKLPGEVAFLGAFADRVLRSWFGFMWKENRLSSCTPDNDLAFLWSDFGMWNHFTPIKQMRCAAVCVPHLTEHPTWMPPTGFIAMCVAFQRSYSTFKSLWALPTQPGSTAARLNHNHFLSIGGDQVFLDKISCFREEGSTDRDIINFQSVQYEFIEVHVFFWKTFSKPLEALVRCYSSN